MTGVEQAPDAISRRPFDSNLGAALTCPGKAHMAGAFARLSLTGITQARGNALQRLLREDTARNAQGRRSDYL